MFRNLLLLAGSVLLCVALVEAGAALVRPPAAQRALFYSENPWRSDPRGFLTWAPAARVRTAAVYGEVVDYDVVFTTNARGFVDDRDYPAARRGAAPRRLAVVGDSFTAGFHGGTAWVPALRRAPGFDPARQEILNLGVSGTGLPAFERLLDATADELGIDEILIVAIRSDFSRPLLRVESDGDRIWLCELAWTSQACRARDTPIFTMSPGADLAALRARVAEQGRERESSLVKRFRQRSFVLSLLRGLRSAARRDDAPGLAALAAIRARFPDMTIRLLHLPQKSEAMEGGFERLRGPVEAAGVEYVDGARCGLRRQDFHEFDGHPNAAGYAKIGRCVAEILEIGASGQAGRGSSASLARSRTSRKRTSRTSVPRSMASRPST